MDHLLDEQLGTENASAPVQETRLRNAIAVIVTRFPRIDETFILREINELEKNGQAVLVVPIAEGTDIVVHEEAKPWVRRALYTPFLSRGILLSNLRSLGAGPLRYLRLWARLITRTAWRPSTLLQTVALIPKSVHLARLLGERGIRHVHAHSATHAATMAYVMSQVSELTYSFTVHGPDVFVHRLLLREKIREARFIRCVSTFNKAFLSGLYPHLTEGKLHVVHSGLNPDVYESAARQAPSRRTTPLLLSVAALDHRNGYPFLLDACAKLIADGVDVECRIVGDGPLRAPTEEWIAQKGLSEKVRILGNLPQNEVARLMGEADVYVLPSIIAVNGEMEGIPISLMEAMAAGKPVVAAAISGIPELVKHDISGILVDATYANRLAEAVRRLLNDPALRERLGRAAQERVRRNFHVRDTARALITLFDGHHPQAEQSNAQRITALDWSRLGVDAVGVRKVEERPDSIVAEVTISDGHSKREVIVRQARGGDDSLERARAEFETLSVLRQTLGAAGDERTGGIHYAVPRLLMFDEIHRAVVLERADGKALSGLLNESGGEGGRIAVAFRRAGCWLQLMQQHTHSGEDGRHVLTAIVLLALRNLELAATADRAVRRRQDAVTDGLHRLEAVVAARPVRVVGHHGHYCPENIFIGDRRVDVIDFGAYREGLPLEDVAHLLLHVELAIGRGPALTRLERELLQGFGDAQPDLASLKLFSIAAVLEMLAHTADEGASLREWRHRRTLRAILARHLRT